MLYITTAIAALIWTLVLFLWGGAGFLIYVFLEITDWSTFRFSLSQDWRDKRGDVKTESGDATTR